MRRIFNIVLFLLFAAPLGGAYAAEDVDLLSYDRVRPVVAPDAAPINLRIQPPSPVVSPVQQSRPMPPLQVKKAAAQPAKPLVRKPAPLPADAIGLQDDLGIFIEGEPDLSGPYTIAQDGTVTLPLIGKIKAAGRTPKALQAVLIAKYKDGYLVDPDIRVTHGAGP
jgi:protein involved in polysaccharide export with SLBB domain